HRTMAAYPAAAGPMLIALDCFLGPTQEVAVVGKGGDVETQHALTAIRQAFRPNQVVAFHDPGTGTAAEFIPLLKDKPAVDGKVTVYVCENFACKAPLVGTEAVEQVFGERPGLPPPPLAGQRRPGENPPPPPQPPARPPPHP